MSMAHQFGRPKYGLIGLFGILDMATEHNRTAKSEHYRSLQLRSNK